MGKNKRERQRQREESLYYFSKIAEGIFIGIAIAGIEYTLQQLFSRRPSTGDEKLH